MNLCDGPRTHHEPRPTPATEHVTGSAGASRPLSPAEVKSQFRHRGTSVSTWADERGFPRALVYAVLNGRRKCLRGTSHDIAVALGLKRPRHEPDELHELPCSCTAR